MSLDAALSSGIGDDGVHDVHDPVACHKSMRAAARALGLLSTDSKFDGVAPFTAAHRKEIEEAARLIGGPGSFNKAAWQAWKDLGEEEKTEWERTVKELEDIDVYVSI